MRTDTKVRVWGLVNAFFMVVFGIAIGIVAWQIWTLANSTNDALCTFRADLQQRYADGGVFLKDHPDGIQGISRADIVRSLGNQKATLDALSTLKCK